jgi:hypothetical protein
MMLHEVLPRLVVASKPTESPVFVRITFPLSFTPLQAWKDTRDALVDVATAYGIGALAPNDESVFSRLPAFAGFVAEGLKDQGRRLWLLIDECQVPQIFNLICEHDLGSSKISYCVPFGLRVRVDCFCLYFTGTVDQCSQREGKGRCFKYVQVFDCIDIGSRSMWLHRVEHADFSEFCTRAPHEQFRDVQQQ